MISSSKKLLLGVILSSITGNQSFAIENIKYDYLNSSIINNIFIAIDLEQIKKEDNQFRKIASLEVPQLIKRPERPKSLEPQEFRDRKESLSLAALPAVAHPAAKPRRIQKQPTRLSGFFGTKAIAFSSIASKSEWQRVRHSAFTLDSENCATHAACNARAPRFQAMLEKAENARFYDKLTLVNRLVNTQIAYHEDDQIYGKLDYWASAQETLALGRGDCEDFAIMKYSLLRKLGVPEKSMSLVVLKDTARNLYHAVLAVSTSKGNFILDNVRNTVHQDTQIVHYQPLYSFSDDRSWIHGKPVQAGDREVTTVAFKLGSITPGKSSDAGNYIAPPTQDVTWDLAPEPLQTLR